MGWITSLDNWIALATLTVLEVVLGIDNIVFISILAGKLPPARQARALIDERTVYQTGESFRWL